jgi:O-acetylhomoserine (thiol)-lyase
MMQVYTHIETNDIKKEKNMDNKINGFTSRILHLENKKADPHGALRFPVYECAAFEYESAEKIAGAFDGSQPAHAYSRVSNPTVEALEMRITEAAGGFGAIALSSGMAAISNTILTLCEAGSSIVASKYLFGNTLCLFEDTLKPWGLKVKYVDPRNPDQIRDAIDTTTRLVFVETISNPQIIVTDVKAVADVCKDKNVPLVLDNSLATSYCLCSAGYGVALEVVSAAKYISGGGTALGGCIIDNGCFDWSMSPRLNKKSKSWGRSTFLKMVRSSVARNVGACLSPHSAYLQMLGLETLALRIERSTSNAIKIAEFLKNHHSITNVNYPGIAFSPYYSLSLRQFRNGLCGGLMSFDLKKEISAQQCINNLKLIKRASNFNDNKSLVIHPATTLFCEYSEEQLLSMGITINTIRLSVGIEEIDDIIGDLENALEN